MPTLAERLERLESALPKTEDGVTVVPGMTVWWYYGRLEWMEVHRVSADMIHGYGGGQPYYIRDRRVPFWSSKHCALQYHAEAKRNEAEDAAREASECNH